MLVKLLCSRASAAGAQNAGDLIEVGGAEARALIASGSAELVKDEVKRGTKKVETAKKRAPRKEKRG